MTQHEKQSKAPGWFDGYSEQFKNLYGVDPRVGVQPNSFTRAVDHAVAPAADAVRSSFRYANNAANNFNAAQKAFREVGFPDTWSDAGKTLANSAKQTADAGLTAAGLDPKTFYEALPNTPTAKAIGGAAEWVAGPATPPTAPAAPAAAPAGPAAAAGSGFGSTFGKNLLLGGGLGLGAVGTYYLMNKLLSGRRQRQNARNFQSPYGPPKFASAEDVWNTIQDTAGKAKDYAAGAIGRGADALASSVGGGDWLAPSPEGMLQGGVNKALGVGGVAAGLGGAYMLARHLAKRQKRHTEQSDIEDARNEYLAALTGAKAASLDEAYEKYATLADVINSAVALGKQVPDAARKALDAAKATGEAGLATALLSGAAGAGLGGVYMYNKTRNNSLSANALKAQAMKARMRSLPGTWIDPEELVKVKQMALANNAAAT